MQVPPELRCMEPENFRKNFRQLCWTCQRVAEPKFHQKISKKDKIRRLKTSKAITVCHAPLLLGNPSQFSVYAHVRRSVLCRWRELNAPPSDFSDDSDSDDSSIQIFSNKLPKVTGIGLRTVFALVSQARFTDASFCEHALNALLDVLQGHTPEELAQEPTEVISNLHGMLVEVASGSGPTGRTELPTTLTALSSSCLVALSVARGEAELILNVVTSLIMSPSALSDQFVQIPTNLTTLQRSVQSAILGTPSRNQWLNYGVPHQSLVTSFPIDLPNNLTTGASELIVRSLVSDGYYLYVYTSRGLMKIGSGYGSSIRQHVYLYRSDFFASDRHGWLGFCKNNLYLRIGRKKTEVYEIDKETLEVKNMVRLEPGHPSPVEPKCAIFTDGYQLGLIVLTRFDMLAIKMYDVDTPFERAESSATTSLTSRKELLVPLLRRKTLIFGSSPFEDVLSRRCFDVDAPIALQLDDCEEDPLTSIYSGQDFALLMTMSGKVYYCGKGQSLGYKAASPQNFKWTLMKETLFSRNQAQNIKRCKVVQVAVGHEGVHAVLVLDNGTTLFTGLARRGEDGDMGKHRRPPKPTRPKKIFKALSHHVIFAACNNGSTALITRKGLLLMFGKDTQHCDSAGIVTGLRHEVVTQVALGKAHAVALTNSGQIYTFGINNKGQCGREFGYTKEKLYPSRRPSPLIHDDEPKEETRLCTSSHTWTKDDSSVCVLCRERTGRASACHCSPLANRVKKCGCAAGDGGCSVCGICRRCADAFTTSGRSEPNTITTDLDDDADSCSRDATKSDKENQAAGSEGEREASLKVCSLPPARVAVPGGHRIVSVACGLHHTVLLTDQGDVLTFGSNQYGQLGAGDISAHHRFVRVRVPRALMVTAGSNHTAVLTRDGEIYTFGNYQKGSLGRPRVEVTPKTDRSPIWYATPGRVPRLGSKHASKAIWLNACGDQTFVQISQSIVKTDTLFSSTITADSNSIVILPKSPEHTFKCLTINRKDGVCKAWRGPEQVDFVNTLACIDPLYDVMWCYQPKLKVMKCYNILAFDPHKTQRCCNLDSNGYFGEIEFEYPNCGNMKRLEDFKNLEQYDLTFNTEGRPTENFALSNMSVLNQEIALPTGPGFTVTRMHVALHLLGCLDSLTYAYDSKFTPMECKREYEPPPADPLPQDFLTVNRFESHGGGWGYSGHSIEAIRFMCDTDIILGGFGLYGGRGDYTAKIKLFDIGVDGGDQESDGELVVESDDIPFECAPRDKCPVLFDVPVNITANKWYVAWACITGPSSDCGSSGQAMVINDEIGFHFKTSKKSNNGTDINAGQIPCLLYNTSTPVQPAPPKKVDLGEPVTQLSKNISRKITVPCFKALVTLLQWSWDTFKEHVLETNGLATINFNKLSLMKQQKRLVYVIRACLRLIKSYINEIYPQNNRKRNSNEYLAYYGAVADVKILIQTILGDATPTCSMLPKKPGKSKAQRVCYVQFPLEMTTLIVKEAHETFTECFYAFFPTPALKWNHLCSMLNNVKDGVVPPAKIRELTATCAALCGYRCLQDILHHVVPVTQSAIVTNDSRRKVHKMGKEFPSKPVKEQTPPLPKDPPDKNDTRTVNFNVEMGKEFLSKPVKEQTPPLPKDPPDKNDTRTVNFNVEPRQSSIQQEPEWNLLDVETRVLDIVMMPIKQLMMTRQCGQPHDHGEIRQHEQLSDFCCKLITRIVGELSFSAINIREMDFNALKHIMTPTRYVRVNQSRAWNTGNGSPDAICFTVDRPGIVLAGVGVYGGLGNYEYSLELLHDTVVRPLQSNSDEANPSHCWVSVEVAHGAFSAIDCQHDIVQLKFDRPVVLKHNVQYAIRLCNHGGRTLNGDCGLPWVKGPDGTVFRFSSCSLSFNGTTLSRGQIPCLIYYGTPQPLPNTSESANILIAGLRAIALRVTSIIIERGADLFCTLRNELTTEDLKRNASVLQQSPIINTLIPYTLSSLEGLTDSKSVVALVEMIHKLLPHVAAMNLLVPNKEEMTTTTGHYYTWVESDHPYKQATVSNMRVLFPSNVSWIVIEIDPRSVTAQPEDSLTVFVSGGSPRAQCHCTHEVKVNDPPFRKSVVHLTPQGEVEELGDDGDLRCMHHNCTYISVTPRMANNCTDWPGQAILVPGNELIFSLETATDYLTEYNKTNNEESRYGFRCLCVGYEDAPLTTQRQGLVALEMELVYAGSWCASRLLAPDLDIPSLTCSIMVDVQIQAASGANGMGVETETTQDGSEALFLSRGLELTSPPNVHHILDGQPLVRCVSTERQFLSDFIAGAETTAGGRLARWLAPISRVEPANCELIGPTESVCVDTTITLPILVRDQYGEPVVSPALTVDVLVQRIDCNVSKSNAPEGSTSVSDAYRPDRIPEVLYIPTVKDNMCYHAISMMKTFQKYSFEELRYSRMFWGDAGRFRGYNVERLMVQSQSDGTYIATWTPRVPATYVFRCTLDDQPTLQELTAEVIENTLEGPSDRGVQAGGTSPSPPPAKMLRFVPRFSAGLRVRASPSLQAEEVGQVPPGANIEYVEEVVNKDGTWVRLGQESLQAFAESAEVAWCLQQHRHLDRTLLFPIEPSSPPQAEFTDNWNEYGDLEREIEAWVQNPEDDDDDGVTEITCNDDASFPPPPDDFLAENEATPFLYAALEPSKRGRISRSESLSCTASPSRIPRRSNGNSDEWWSPVRHRTSENSRDVDTIQETEIEAEPNHEIQRSRLAQMGTQTSPDDEGSQSTMEYNEGMSAQSSSRDRPSSRGRTYKRLRSPPPIPPPRLTPPARVTPRSRVTSPRVTPPPPQMSPPPPPPPSPPPPPRKLAVSPAQAECLRAVFAALLWHEGIVHDAIACAAFLKFHPELPKQGTQVVTRPAHDVSLARFQRHSVEVSSAGHYLHIDPSTLETLTRSGAEAAASRMKSTDVEMRGEEAGCSSQAVAGPSIVTVLPPALRALVALWDALYESDQLSAATNKKGPGAERNENEDIRGNSGIRKKRDWNAKLVKTPYTVRCDLCGGASVPPPLVSHMRNVHPGCGGSTTKGFDRSGTYHAQEPHHNEMPGAVCGQFAQLVEELVYRTDQVQKTTFIVLSFEPDPMRCIGRIGQGEQHIRPGPGSQIYYMFCEKCYELAIKTVSPVRPTRSKVISEISQYEGAALDHQTMKDNALFLLDLAPLTNSDSLSEAVYGSSDDLDKDDDYDPEPINMSGWNEASRSSLTPPGSIWQPAPPFQCLQALGAAPRPSTSSEAPKFHSLGRSPAPLLNQTVTVSEIVDMEVGSPLPRVHRSVSMGPAGGKDLAHAACPPLIKNTPVDRDALSAAGTSLLAQPSASLRRLMGIGDWTDGAGSVSAFEPPRLDCEALINSPVLSFILAKRDLHIHRQKMDAAIRINTMRQYAFEALNWLLRSTTQPIGLHDVMWWFCVALDRISIVPLPPSAEDQRENPANEGIRRIIPTASAIALCPGGTAARWSRAAFHTFLGSVSSLAPSLPPSSAVALQAVRCWALHYSSHDRAFLHRSQVFSVISKILSHSEDGEDIIMGAQHESFHSYIHKENYVWSLPDVTGWCDLSVSSRQGMAGALTDGSTETFWESGDEDRNKCKWIDVLYPGGSANEQPHIVCVHIDNTRDTAYKIQTVSFLHSGGTPEWFHMQDIEIDNKTAAWICYTLPRVSRGAVRIRCEIRGPEAAVRVRQVRVLGPPAHSQATQSHLLHALAETDTLRVFRLLTSQIFGKLLEWDRSGSDSGGEGTSTSDEGAATDDSDLREHVVGILFAGHKLTSLQRQVMSHIVTAIGSEAVRVKDDWETALLCAEAAEREEIPARHVVHTQDNYCFEMLSLLLALSGSSVGHAHLAQRTEIIPDLLSLLHTGSERVQRQVISLLRRMVTEIDPQKMLAAINAGQDAPRVTLLDHLVAYLGKALSVQMKVKGARATTPTSATLGNSVNAIPPANWFMRGETTKKHAHLVAKLLTDMCEDRIFPQWGLETRNALAAYIRQVAQVSESERRPAPCIAAPTIWMALAALCICDQSHIELSNGGSESRRGENETRSYCANHDDGSTFAVIDCQTCGPLCAECDRFLHLNRAARTHQRQISKEEESNIRIDIHEGCGRAKLFWILLLVDRRTLKGLVEFRGMENGLGDNTAIESSAAATATAGVCRFCGSQGNSGLLAIGNVCADQQCQEHGRQACTSTLNCGHICGGVRDEPTCLPCLHGCAGRGNDTAPLRQDADDMCMICFTDPLQAAPALQLRCGHVFHLHCCKKVLANKWIGPRITFSFSQCPICKEDMEHWTLEELLGPIRELQDEVRRKALMRLEYEGGKVPDSSKGGPSMDPATYAMERFAYYACHKCGKAYFGGVARCEAEMGGRWEPGELACGACSNVAGAKICSKHGSDFLEYKCRYCCSVAVFFCFGTSHFCNACHDDFQRVTNIPKHLLPQCPAASKGEQLPGTSEECPLRVQHPPTGEEFALGCGVCRHTDGF